MLSNIVCICLSFRHCAFSNQETLEEAAKILDMEEKVINCLLNKMYNVHCTYSHIGCICLSFLHFAFSNQERLEEAAKILDMEEKVIFWPHFGCICLSFLHFVFVFKSREVGRGRKDS